MDEIEALKLDYQDGNVDAFIPFADELAMRGHPHGEELMDTALWIRDCPDWQLAMMAVAVFEELVADERGTARVRRPEEGTGPSA
jgi:hypothetical protein